MLWLTIAQPKSEGIATDLYNLIINIITHFSLCSDCYVTYCL